jgi:ATP-dependent DNA helicase RecQ
LKLDEKGHEFLRNPVSFLLSEDNDYSDTDEEEESFGGPERLGTADEELFNILKNLRKKLAKQLQLPPFVIFQDPSLEDMSIQYPISLEELQNITGVGAGKAKRYGAEFIKIIQSYVEEKEIIRPQDMVVKSIVNKSNLKVFIIQSIDRKMDFEDIAQAKNLDLNALLDEIEAIVNSGTKINIDYYINNIMEKDHQEDIYNYFMEEAEDESIENALQELGEDNYTEEEIRLMRIKFMSELGN